MGRYIDPRTDFGFKRLFGQEGCQEEKRETARSMARRGLDLALIQEVTGLSVGEITQLIEDSL